MTTYYERHREERLAYDKKYREENKELVTQKDKERNKIYYEANKEKIAETKRLYRANKKLQKVK